MTWFVRQECRFIIGILPKVLEVHRFFEFHNCGCMTKDIGTCSEDIVQKFYVSYAATLLGYIDRSKRSTNQAPLTSTLLQCNRVQISQATIHLFLYIPTTGSQWTWNTSKFDYRQKIVQSFTFRNIEEQRESMKKWLAQFITKDGERVDWVISPRVSIRKTILSFLAIYFQIIV